MADLPYMKFYIGDYDAKTAHLTLEEDGVYNRLLRLCWQTTGCSIPDDPRWISRKMRTDLDTFHRVIDPIIKEFFVKDQGRVFQSRQRAEWIAAIETNAKLSDNGKKSARIRKSLKLEDIEVNPVPARLEPGSNRHSHSQSHSQNQINAASLERKILGFFGLELGCLPRAWLTLPEQIAEWRSYDLTDAEIEAVISRIAARGTKPSGPSYFTPALHDAACEKAGLPKIPATKPRRMRA